MFGRDFAYAGLFALVFALVVSVIVVFLLSAIAEWMARRRGE